MPYGEQDDERTEYNFVFSMRAKGWQFPSDIGREQGAESFLIATAEAFSERPKGLHSPNESHGAKKREAVGRSYRPTSTGEKM